MAFFLSLIPSVVTLSLTRCTIISSGSNHFRAMAYLVIICIYKPVVWSERTHIQLATPAAQVELSWAWLLTLLHDLHSCSCTLPLDLLLPLASQASQPTTFSSPILQAATSPTKDPASHRGCTVWFPGPTSPHIQSYLPSSHPNSTLTP